MLPYGFDIAIIIFSNIWILVLLCGFILMS